MRLRDRKSTTPVGDFIPKRKVTSSPSRKMSLDSRAYYNASAPVDVLSCTQHAG